MRANLSKPLSASVKGLIAPPPRGLESVNWDTTAARSRNLKWSFLFRVGSLLSIFVLCGTSCSPRCRSHWGLGLWCTPAVSASLVHVWHSCVKGQSSRGGVQTSDGEAASCRPCGSSHPGVQLLRGPVTHLQGEVWGDRGSHVTLSRDHVTRRKPSARARGGPGPVSSEFKMITLTETLPFWGWVRPNGLHFPIRVFPMDKPAKHPEFTPLFGGILRREVASLPHVHWLDVLLTWREWSRNTLM